MLIFSILLALLSAVVGGTIAADTRRRRTALERDEADDLEAARLRLVAAGEDPDAPAVFTGRAAAVYMSRQHTTLIGDHPTTETEPLDARTAVLVVDPTLSATEVAQVIEHVEPGAGSLASFAATACDTREMRTHAEQHHLETVYDTAHDEDIRRDLSAAFARHEDDSADVWATIDAWVERYHGSEHYADCVHCAEWTHEQSDEYAQLVARVEGEHTREIPRVDVRALLHGATT